MLLLDAKNALNRATALANIRHICFTTLINMTLYHSSSELFLGQSTLLSQEGTTQGDPLAMPFYAVATTPLINSLSTEVPTTKQVWYADNVTVSGKIGDLRVWCEKISTIGPAYGYHVNPTKTWVVTKEVHYTLASKLFRNTNVNITTDVLLVLGSPIGTLLYVSQFTSKKVQEWVEDARN